MHEEFFPLFCSTGPSGCNIVISSPLCTHSQSSLADELQCQVSMITETKQDESGLLD